MKYIKDVKVMIWVPEKQRIYKVNHLTVIIIIYIKNRLNNDKASRVKNI